MSLTHYIIVRRDMPLGVVCAQVTHAAGESFARTCLWDNTVGSHNLPGTVAIVLGARDEKQLKYYERRLEKAGVDYTAIHENAGFAAGQMTAIGCWPTEDRAKVFKVLKKLNPISELITP